MSRGKSNRLTHEGNHSEGVKKSRMDFRPPGGVSWRNLRAQPFNVDSNIRKIIITMTYSRQWLPLPLNMRILRFRRKTPPERAGIAGINETIFFTASHSTVVINQDLAGGVTKILEREPHRVRRTTTLNNLISRDRRFRRLPLPQKFQNHPLHKIFGSTHARSRDFAPLR